MSLIRLILDVIQVLAIIIAGIWAYRKFNNTRESFPKVEFDLNAKGIGRRGDNYLVEVEAKLTNKGLVRHYIEGASFLYNVRLIHKGEDKVKTGFNTENGDLINQAVFPEKLFESDQKWVTFSTVFIDPNVTQYLTAVLALPATTEFFQLKGEFKYSNSSDIKPHTSVRSFNMQEILGPK